MKSKLISYQLKYSTYHNIRNYFVAEFNKNLCCFQIIIITDAYNNINVNRFMQQTFSNF